MPTTTAPEPITTLRINAPGMPKGIAQFTSLADAVDVASDLLGIVPVLLIHPVRPVQHVTMIGMN